MQIKSEPTVRVIAGAFQGRDAAVLGEQFEEFVQDFGFSRPKVVTRVVTAYTLAVPGAILNVPADWVVPLAAELAAC